jgi:hypothetical protein
LQYFAPYLSPHQHKKLSSHNWSDDRGNSAPVWGVLPSPISGIKRNAIEIFIDIPLTIQNKKSFCHSFYVEKNRFPRGMQ